MPDGYQLDAWTLWSRADMSEDWLIHPITVLESEGHSVDVHYLGSLMHGASLSASDRKYRLSCKGLLNYLVERSASKLWLTDERTTTGVMTDFAFHCAYGSARL